MEIEMEPRLRSDVESYYGIASDILQTQGDLQPMALLRVGIKWNLVPLLYNDDQAKDKSMRVLKQLASKIDADACIMINEAWMVTVDKDEDTTNVVPSEHPKRREILCMTVQVKGTPGAWMSDTPIFRSGEKIVIPSKDPKFEYLEHVGGRMLDVFTGGEQCTST